MKELWKITENTFDPKRQHHKETVFTIGNGYLSTRGAFEESYPGERRGTLIHGLFDPVPIATTELANAPDWLPFNVYLNGERFQLHVGAVEEYQRTLDMREGVLRRRVVWRSPQGKRATITFERFASLANPHLLFIRCCVKPGFEGEVEFRASLNGCTDNQRYAHWTWLDQGMQDEIVYLRNRTRGSKIELASAMRTRAVLGDVVRDAYWDAQNAPTQVLKMEAVPGEQLIVEKYVAMVSSHNAQDPLKEAIEHAGGVVNWSSELDAQRGAWAGEWERSDVELEGDDEAQLAIRYNLFQMLIAGPRQDDRVNIGAKTLSGFGYHGHCFWDTEIFMLPLFIYTSPDIARNLLNYRYMNLPEAREKARQNGYEGAQYPWESADTGHEVTPSWVPHFDDPSRLVRIWTGDIEIHISADIAYAAHQYWQATGDDPWLIEKGAEMILDTAKFWGSRAEWNPEMQRYEYNDVIGPDEYHEHVDNNAFTNHMAQWNLQTGLEVLRWLKTHAPERAAELTGTLDLSPKRLDHWRQVIEKIFIPRRADGLIEQFEGYFQREDVDLAAMEPRQRSVQAILGIEGTNRTQAIKQPDVLMLLYLLREHYPEELVRVNYDYYTPRTDHTYGSSLGPAIQASMASRVGKPEEAYEHFMRAVMVDLEDVRGNAGDGIHGASAGAAWQAIIFGFAGLRITPQGWQVEPNLPRHWSRLTFRFFYQGEMQEVDLKGENRRD